MYLFKRALKVLTIVGILLSTMLISGCELIDKIEIPGKNTEYECTVESYKILIGKPSETTVYLFHSNGNKPKVAIIGGTHGDETAGWKAALKLVEKMDWAGDVLLIPQCNIVADNLQQRYAGLGKPVDGVIYSDLNRSYPGYETTPATATKAISDAIRAEIEAFDPDCIIDLHESRQNASQAEPGSSGLGSLLIFGNTYSAFPAMLIVDEFNENCLEAGEDTFATDTNAPKGSYNAYFGNLFSDAYVFTTETSRTYKESRRIEQQLDLINIILEYVYK